MSIRSKREKRCRAPLSRALSTVTQSDRYVFIQSPDDENGPRSSVIWRTTSVNALELGIATQRALSRRIRSFVRFQSIGMSILTDSCYRSPRET